MTDLNMAAVMSLSGRVGLVTGGGTGIGFTIAKAFAANGAKVYITGRRLNVLKEAAASATGVPGSLVPLRMDVTDEESVKAGAKHIEGIDGKLDVLVNNAGFAASFSDPDFVAKASIATDPLELETVQNWMDIFALNTIGPFFVVRAFQSLLVKGAHSRPQGMSSVINISSATAKINMTAYIGCMAYGATKVALEKLTLVLATSFSQRDIPIRVNVLRPGAFASQLANPDFVETIKTKPPPGLVAPVPARRHGNDAEMGMTAIYLAVSDYTNGAILIVDGGVSLRAYQSTPHKRQGNADSNINRHTKTCQRYELTRCRNRSSETRRSQNLAEDITVSLHTDGLLLHAHPFQFLKAFRG